MKKIFFYILTFLSFYFFLVFCNFTLSFSQYILNKKFTKNQSAFEIYRNLSKKNQNTVLKIPTNLYLNEEFKFYPLSGIKNSYTINCNELGFWSFYNSDKFGFNNNNEIYERDISNLLLGDSFVHGSCVNEKDTISSNLNKSGLSTLNLGYSGNGPIRNLATYIEYGKQIDSIKNIFFFIYENDYLDLKLEKKNKILNKYLVNPFFFSQNLIANEIIVSNIKKKVFNKELDLAFKNDRYSIYDIDDFNFRNEIKDSFKLIMFRKLINKKFITLKIPEGEKIHKDEDILDLINIIGILNTIKKPNQNLIVIYLPEYFNLLNSVNKITNEDYYNEKLLFSELTKKNIDFINIKKKFLKSKNFKKMYAFEGYSHFSPLGYKTVSNAIIDYLK